jgi:hypothetical protein
VGVHGGDGDPGADGEHDSENDGDSPKLGKVPLDGGHAVGSVVVGNGQGGNVGEDGNEDHKLDVEGAVEDGDPKTKVDLEVDGQGDTVDDVGVHAVENLARGLQGIDNGTKTGSEEDDVGGGAGGVGGTLDSDTGISLLQRGSVVDTVARHRYEVSSRLKDLNLNAAR